MWWESPWIVFPERRYLLLLLMFLMMIQNPLLAYAYFKPHLYGSATVRTISDIMVGVGVQGMLMMWLFVVQGVRYHTASFALRREKHQRQLLELRRAAKYVADSKQGNYGTDEVHLSAYMDEFFERFGDVDGIRSVGDLAIRLKSDPCGDSWADFLLPKLLLFSIGVAAVVITAVVRFPTSTNSNVVLDPSRLHTLNVLYVGSSIIQMLVLIYWIYLILRNTFLTGAKLRKEPFLSTRPAQLAYRVLLGMLLLGVGVSCCPFSDRSSEDDPKVVPWKNIKSHSRRSDHGPVSNCRHLYKDPLESFSKVPVQWYSCKHRSRKATVCNNDWTSFCFHILAFQAIL